MSSEVVQLVTNLVSPPNLPIGPGSESQWNNLKQSHAIEFPLAYRDILRCYGGGDFSPLFSLMSPFSTDRDIFEAHSLAVAIVSKQSVLPLWSPTVSRGLFQVGGDSYGGKLFVSTKPEDNLCVYFADQSQQIFQMDLAQLILEMVQGELMPPSMTHLPTHPSKAKEIQFLPEPPKATKGVFG